MSDLKNILRTGRYPVIHFGKIRCIGRPETRSQAVITHYLIIFRLIKFQRQMTTYIRRDRFNRTFQIHKARGVKKR